METLIIRGHSEIKAKLILKLAKELNFSAKKLNSNEAEEIGIALSIDEGIKSGLLSDQEKVDFIKRISQD